MATALHPAADPSPLPQNENLLAKELAIANNNSDPSTPATEDIGLEKVRLVVWGTSAMQQYMRPWIDERLFSATSHCCSTRQFKKKQRKESADRAPACCGVEILWGLPELRHGGVRLSHRREPSAPLLAGPAVCQRATRRAQLLAKLVVFLLEPGRPLLEVLKVLLLPQPDALGRLCVSFETGQSTLFVCRLCSIRQRGVFFLLLVPVLLLLLHREIGNAPRMCTVLKQLRVQLGKVKAVAAYVDTHEALLFLRRRLLALCWLRPVGLCGPRVCGGLPRCCVWRQLLSGGQ